LAGRDHDASVENVQRAAVVRVAHDAAGLFGDETRGRHVPDVNAVLVVQVTAAVGHIARVECGRAEQSERVNAANQVAHVLGLDVEFLGHAARSELGDDLRLVESGLAARHQGATVHKGALSPHGRVQFVADRIKDHADLRLTVHEQSDGQRAMRESMHKVCRAVHRIHNPDRIVSEVDFADRGLFADEPQSNTFRIVIIFVFFQKQVDKSNANVTCEWGISA
jgi:hypothetical protein